MLATVRQKVMGDVNPEKLLFCCDVTVGVHRHFCHLGSTAAFLCLGDFSG